MMKNLISLIFCSLLFVITLSACDRDEGPVEETREAIEETAEDTGDAVKDATN